MRLTIVAMSLCLILGPVETGCTTDTRPISLATAGGSPPVLESITQTTIVSDGFPVVIPQFHFHDADGDVRFLARELVETDGPYPETRGTTISFPAALQQRGAIFAGRWPCGPNHYHATMRAYLIDQAGNRSNAMLYTIRCNGG